MSAQNTAQNTATTATAPAAKVDKPKGKQLSAMFDGAELEAVEEFRWSNRIERTSDLVRAAVLAYVKPKA